MSIIVVVEEVIHLKALITGASSGIGKEMAVYLDKLGYETFLVSRNKTELEKVQKSLKNKSKIVVMDLCDLNNLKSLYILLKNENIDVLINNAGFGLYGEFTKTEISKEMEMLDINIKAVHTLMKLFLKDMKKRNSGYILNVSSSASFMPGPLMSSYYASKAYVTSITEAVAYELEKEKSNVKVSCLCPGPVDTNFNNVAGVTFSVKPLLPSYVAKYAIDKMFNKKTVIIPGFRIKCVKFFSRFVTNHFIMRFTYKIQKKKRKD